MKEVQQIIFLIHAEERYQKFNLLHTTYLIIFNITQVHLIKKSNSFLMALINQPFRFHVMILAAMVEDTLPKLS